MVEKMNEIEKKENEKVIREGFFISEQAKKDMKKNKLPKRIQEFFDSIDL